METGGVAGRSCRWVGAGRCRGVGGCELLRRPPLRWRSLSSASHQGLTWPAGHPGRTGVQEALPALRVQGKGLKGTAWPLQGPGVLRVAVPPRPSLLFAVGTSAGSAGTTATEGRLAQRLSPEPPELCSATPGPRASVFAGSAAPQPQGTAAPSPPAHAMLEYSPAPDRGPWTPPVATQSASIRPAPPASLLTPAGSAPPGRPPVLQEVIGSPLTFISSPAPSPAPPEDPVTQGGPGTPLEASLSSTLWASAHRGVATPPGSATSSQSRSAEPPGSEENTLEPSGSGSSAGPQRAVTHSEWAAPSQAAHLETPGSRLGPETGARLPASLKVGDPAPGRPALPLERPCPTCYAPATSQGG